LSFGTTSDTYNNPYLYGFNTAALYFHFSNETQGEDLIRELSPKVLRFPGGTTANFYHFDKPGYGYQKSEAESVKGTNAYGNMVSSAKRDLEDSRANGRTENYATDFVQLAKRTGASVLIVTNHLHSDFEENLRMVEFFIASGVPIAGVELGNEYYWKKAYQNVFPDVQSYINSAKPLALKIRSLYPDIPIAVVSAPNAEMKDMGADKSAISDEWNNRLAEETFYDAYVVHLYSKNRLCDKKTSPIEIASCYLEYNEDYIGTTVPNGIQAYEKIFHERKMWVTEWNVKEVFDGLGNTMIQALYFADFSFLLGEHPTIGLATYHNLLSGGDGFNLIRKDKGPSGFITTSAYPVAALISLAFEDDVQSISIDKNSKFPDRYVTIKAFKKGQETLVYIVNKKASAISLDLGDQTGSYRIRTIAADNLIQTSSTIINTDQIFTDYSDVSILPYSVTLITFSHQ
jgi:hypothetical protein